jgi:hypothetical protein
VEPIRFPRLDEQAAGAIAELFGVPLGLAPYRLRGRPVYQLLIPMPSEERPLEMVLWPDLARVDVRVGASAMVFKSVSGVEIYPGVEVLFRRQNPPGHLFVSVGGSAEMAV